MLSLFVFTDGFVYSVFLFQSLMLGPGFLQEIIELHIRIHHIAVIIRRCEQAAEGIGIQDQGENVVITVLLHGAQTRPVLLELVILFLGRYADVLFLPGNFIIIQLDFCSDQGNLLLDQADFLDTGFVPFFESEFLFDDSCLFFFQRLHFVLCADTAFSC